MHWGSCWLVADHRLAEVGAEESRCGRGVDACCGVGSRGSGLFGLGSCQAAGPHTWRHRAQKSIRAAMAAASSRAGADAAAAPAVGAGVAVPSGAAGVEGAGAAAGPMPSSVYLASRTVQFLPMLPRMLLLLLTPPSGYLRARAGWVREPGNVAGPLAVALAAALHAACGRTQPTSACGAMACAQCIAGSRVTAGAVPAASAGAVRCWCGSGHSLVQVVRVELVILHHNRVAAVARLRACGWLVGARRVGQQRVRRPQLRLLRPAM